MARYVNPIPVPLASRITSQQPDDDRLIYRTVAELVADIATVDPQDSEALRFPEGWGFAFIDTLKTAMWIQVSAKPANAVLIAGSEYTYPPGSDPYYEATEYAAYYSTDTFDLAHSGLTLDDGTNPHGTTKTDVGLGNVQDIDTSLHSNITKDDGTNPHGTTKADVGLGSADNTADVDKPTSIATQAQLDTLTTNLGDHATDTTNPHVVTAAQVGLGNADDTSDANKPISDATQIALDNKLTSVQGGTDISINNADPQNPIITYSGTGGSYTGIDIEANILAKNATTSLGEFWFASDTKREWRAITPATTGAPQWMQVSIEYDEPSDTFKLGTTADGQTQNLGQEVFFSAVNDEAVPVLTLNPKLFLAGSAVPGDERFKDGFLAAAADLSAGALYGINTTGADPGGYMKVLTYGDMNDVDTSAWSVNSILYADTTAGELTNIKPGVNVFPVAQVTKQDAVDGKLFVNTISTDEQEVDTVPVGTTRAWFTGDPEVTVAGTFYTTNRVDRGSTISAQEQVSPDDDETLWLSQDHLGPIQAVTGVLQPGQVIGQIEFTVNNTNGSERIYMEMYTADDLGDVIDSGSGLPNGDLGQPPIVILTSPLLNSPANLSLFADMAGTVTSAITVNAGERIRWHIGCEKVGLPGGIKQFTVFFGTDHSTYAQAQLPLTAADITYDSSISSLAAVNVQQAIDEVVNEGINHMRWEGDWADGSYNAYDVVRDGLWTMIANKTTTDRPSPQPEGPLLEFIPETEPLTTTSNISVVKAVILGTTTVAGWSNNVQIYIPNNTVDKVIKFTIINVSTGAIEIISNPIVPSDEWATLKASNNLIPLGAQFRIELETYNASAANRITGGWTSNLGTGIPANQVFNIDNFANPTVIEIDHDDLDNVSRTTELDGVVADSLISINETGDINRNVTVRVVSVDVASATSTKYTVTVESGNNDIRDARTCTINIDVPVTQPTQYVESSGYFTGNPPGFANVTTELYFDNVLQGTVPGTAYGINWVFQPANISADWDEVASSVGASGSFEPYLGLPSTDSRVLLSDTAGARSWTLHEVIVHAGFEALDSLATIASMESKFLDITNAAYIGAERMRVEYGGVDIDKGNLILYGHVINTATGLISIKVFNPTAGAIDISDFTGRTVAYKL